MKIQGKYIDFKEGMLIRVYYEQTERNPFLDGCVGEISNGRIYIWNDTQKGAIGKKLPSSLGYRWSYVLDSYLIPTFWFEILGYRKILRQSLVEHSFDNHE